MFTTGGLLTREEGQNQKGEREPEEKKKKKRRKGSSNMLVVRIGVGFRYLISYKY